MKIKIEEAKRKDIKSIVELGKEMADFHQRVDDYYVSGNEAENSFKKRLGEILSERGAKVLIAKAKNRILAYGIAFIEKPKTYIKPKKIGHLTDLYVREKYRKKGIGRQMFNKFLEWFKTYSIKHIELSVDAKNKIAIAAYKKYGFFEYKKRMRLDL
jgi:ribosomal protein S18 acetylase RimI-like enzyme